VVTGHRFLGGYIGNNEGKREFVADKVASWCQHVKKFADIAKTQPHLVYSAFTKSLQFEWAHLQRVTSHCSEAFSPLEKLITDELLPAIMGSEVTDPERTLLSLPTRTGGIGVSNPVLTATTAYQTSKNATKMIIESIRNAAEYNSQQHSQQMASAKKAFHEESIRRNMETLQEIKTSFDAKRVRAIDRIVNEKTSSWLNVLPVMRNNFDLTATEFRDALSIRYGKPLLQCPATCDGCGSLFNVQHALSCKKGGLVIRRHNEIRDAVGDLSSLIWNGIRREPIVREADDANNIPALIADLGVRGVWEPQRETLLDIRVTDTDAFSYCAQPVRSILEKAENEKKRKYGTACEQRRVSFTPFITSVDGALGREAKAFVNRLSDGLARKWERSYSQTFTWVRTRLSFAIIRATSHCLRGCRSKWRTLGVEDGAFITMALE